MKATALIADDEPLARRRLRDLVAAVEWIECLGEAEDGDSTLRAIDSVKPDLVFLDIEMPGPSGLEVLEQAHHRPAVIFTTAFDRYAVAAFELQALDYLLKPFSDAELAAALERAKRLIQDSGVQQLTERLNDLLGSVRPESRYLSRITVRVAQRVQIVRVAEIDWIEAAGNYVQLHVGRDTHLVHETMKDLAARLAPEQFRRIHRAIIVNLDRIRTIELGARGDGRLVLHDGTRLALSRSYRDQLGELLDG